MWVDVGDTQFSVGELPGRKRPAMFVVEDGTVRVLAYFQSRDALEEFLNWGPKVWPPKESE